MGYKSINIYKVEIHWLRWLISVDIVLILLSYTNLPKTEIMRTTVEKSAKNNLCKIIILMLGVTHSNATGETKLLV